MLVERLAGVVGQKYSILMVEWTRDCILTRRNETAFLHLPTRQDKTASLIGVFLKSCSYHANIALFVMLYRMLYILCVCSACIVLICSFM